ncbi:MAG: RsmE family RNA methyltransferase, partial [Bdellovibrionales bacterium]|nr:RsmE family RNA methyltransferase [Bdellovibrionales bacterium]
MNVVLFDSSEADQNSLCLSDQRARHIVSVLKLKADDEVRIGAINGRLGVGRVQTVAHDAKSGRFDVRLEIKRLDEESPPKSSIELILALPRPKSLRRCLRMIANLGIKSVHLIHSSRVEKSYWSTPFLDHQSMRASLLEGLAIARDTVLPEVKIYKLFKPFVQDVAPSLIHTYGYVAHPSSHLQQAISKPIAP